MKIPLFSVLILCWNSNAYLRQCLQSLHEQTQKDFELILVDNGSKEPVLTEVLESFPDLAIQYYRLEQNVGFAAGNNYAAAHANGQYLVLLNTDAFPNADWLEVIRGAIQRYPLSSFASKLIMANDPQVLDGEGDNYHVTGIVWRKSHGRSITQAAVCDREVFSACGAAAVYPRHAFLDVGGFDEDYFAYSEDVDLGFRLRLVGIPCIYLPSAVVYHVGSGSTSRRSDFSVYYGHRNLVWTFIKNMPGLLLVLLLPGHVMMSLGMLCLAALRKQARVTLKAKRDAWSGLEEMFQKRRAIQKMRKITIISLMKLMDWNPVSPFAKLILK